MTIWPFITIAAAALLIVRNLAQRQLTGRLGVWGAAYVRFLYGLPFALAWGAAIWIWRGPSGGPNWSFLIWVLLGAIAQGAATGALVLAMRGRSFAVVNALLKTEVLGTALLGVALLGDMLLAADWIGVALGAAGALLMMRVSIDASAYQGALAGAGAGVLFAAASVAFRGAALAWGGDAWVAAAATLTATLAAQSLIGLALLGVLAPLTLRGVFEAWRPSLAPGAAGALASALLFTSFAMAPSAAAVKTVQLVDVLMGWLVSRRMLREHVSAPELIGALMVLAGALAVLVR